MVGLATMNPVLFSVSLRISFWDFWPALWQWCKVPLIGWVGYYFVWQLRRINTGSAIEWIFPQLFVNPYFFIHIGDSRRIPLSSMRSIRWQDTGGEWKYWVFSSDKNASAEEKKNQMSLSRGQYMNSWRRVIGKTGQSSIFMAGASRQTVGKKWVRSKIQSRLG